jgi:hypothetical protein
VVLVAHRPEVGVNVYVVVPAVEVLTVEGLHVPVIPFVEVEGNKPGVAPAQYGPSAVNIGVILGFTVTDIEVVAAHKPAVGVNVYMVVPAVEVLIDEGLQVPVIPLFDVVGSVPGIAPTQ